MSGEDGWEWDEGGEDEGEWEEGEYEYYDDEEEEDETPHEEKKPPEPPIMNGALSSDAGKNNNGENCLADDASQSASAPGKVKEFVSSMTDTIFVVYTDSTW